MHARAIDRQATFATQGVVASDLNQTCGGEGADEDLGQDLPQPVEIPDGVAEEAVIATVVAIVSGAAGLNELGDKVVAEGQTPAAHESAKVLEAGLGENVAELV